MTFICLCKCPKLYNCTTVFELLGCNNQSHQKLCGCKVVLLFIKYETDDEAKLQCPATLAFPLQNPRTRPAVIGTMPQPTISRAILCTGATHTTAPFAAAQQQPHCAQRRHMIVTLGEEPVRRGTCLEGEPVSDMAGHGNLVISHHCLPYLFSYSW